MDLTNKNELVSYLKQHELWAKKSMGQNFLVDREVLEKIVSAADLKSSDYVLEIGPGVGALTAELVKYAGRVVAIEKDEKLANLLELRIKNSELCREAEIIIGDVLEIDPKKLIPSSYKLIANIPYYITSKILEKFLTAEVKPELIVLLVQKEVAERICSKAGGLSLLAVSVQYYGEPELVDVVKRASFFPVPEVDSAILRIRVNNNSTTKNYKQKTQKVDEKEFFKVVKAGFRARRKTLFNNLKAGTNLNSGQVVELLDKMNISRNARAQELTIEQWSKIAREIKNSQY
jgi:16S rRNA (adenine1518-N6/adenine1519-N6)-dimethyltransferase